MFLFSIVGTRKVAGLLFGLGQLIAAVVVLSISETQHGPTNSLGVAVAVWQGLGPCILVIVAVTVVAVEGPAMLAKEWGKKHREEGRREEAKEWRDALESTGMPPEEMAKIEAAKAAKREAEE